MNRLVPVTLAGALITACAYDPWGPVQPGTTRDAGPGDGCTARSDEEICRDLDHQCGALEATDCGKTRTIASCGRCDEGLACVTFGASQFCGCDPTKWQSMATLSGGGVQSRQHTLAIEPRNGDASDISHSNVVLGIVSGSTLRIATHSPGTAWDLVTADALGAAAPFSEAGYAFNTGFRNVGFVNASSRFLVTALSTNEAKWYDISTEDEPDGEVLSARFTRDTRDIPAFRQVALHLKKLGGSHTLAYATTAQGPAHFRWVETAAMTVDDVPLDFALDAAQRPFIAFRSDGKLAIMTSPSPGDDPAGGVKSPDPLEDLAIPAPALDATRPQVATANYLATTTVYVAAQTGRAGGKILILPQDATAWVEGPLPDDATSNLDLTTDVAKGGISHAHLVYGGVGGLPVIYARRRQDGDWVKTQVTAKSLDNPAIAIDPAGRVRIVGVAGGELVEYWSCE